MVTFRDATREDVPAIVALLRDDTFGAARETAEEATYLAAFEAMAGETANHLIVGVEDGRIVATYQLTLITGLSHRGMRRANIESVRVAADRRGQGLGHSLMRDAEARAQAAGCGMLQLTTTAERSRARAFYDRLGYTPSHIGFKRVLGP
ncbi:GNAT family N-acetyltransferase [Ovoidimarina sediminis]|uniref:GNAT family N-acetyltransferase n=1 Tax=Ovoidimarina sediminis TaxID=3079856 RepID=UPI00290F415D|nr:GNAT family N-acetyltransferase [Rhodophyticola sp. MJ-SS7]MDU8942798.1 GNAT family N-acetyltransferase [Rhodophyticola sp. MJ-SS7]